MVCLEEFGKLEVEFDFFLDVLSLYFCARASAFSSCGEQGLLSSCGMRASHCSGFSCC